MRTTLLLLALVLTGASALHAQDSGIESETTGNYPSAAEQVRLRESYTNFAWVMQTLSSQDGAIEIGKSDFGAAFTKGRTFFLHRRPIARLMYIGLDATWFEVNYAHYKQSLLGEKLNHTDITLLGVGPSVNIYPVNRLGVHAYARYNPTFSSVFDGGFSSVLGGYQSTIVGGASVSWGAIGLGAEARWGKAKYQDLAGELLDKVDDILDRETTGSNKKESQIMKSSAVRVYLSLRF